MTTLTIPDRGSRSGNLVSERRRYQQQVAVLLETVTQGVEKLERLRARGLRGRALAEHEAELSAARRELAALVDSRERNRVPTRERGGCMHGAAIQAYAARNQHGRRYPRCG